MTKARLLACPGCARHVRVSEPACVFCGLVLPESFGERPAVPPPPRMSRGGLFAYRARAIAASTAALVTASCGAALEAGPSEAGSKDGESDGYSVVDSSSGDSPFGDDAISTLYGLPADVYVVEPPDATGPADATGPIDAEPLDAQRLDASKRDAGTADSGISDAPARDVVIAPPYGIPAYGSSP